MILNVDEKRRITEQFMRQHNLKTEAELLEKIAAAPGASARYIITAEDENAVSSFKTVGNEAQLKLTNGMLEITADSPSKSYNSTTYYPAAWSTGVESSFVSKYTGPIEAFKDPVSGLPFYGSSGDLLVVGKGWSIQLHEVKLNREVNFSDVCDKVIPPIPPTYIPWTDRSVGTMNINHFTKIILTARALYTGKIINRVVVNCVGGHGRTGTFLGIIGSLIGAIPEDKNPVNYIRKAYKQEAIESEAQAQFVEYVHEFYHGHCCMSSDFCS